MSRYFAAIAPAGWIWPDTCRHRAKDARRAMGEIFMGMRLGGEKIETYQQGWAYALKQGYRIHEVSIERIDQHRGARQP